MKKLLLTTLASTILLGSLLSAEETQTKHHYKVEILDNSKKGWGKVIYKIGDFCFSIVVGAVSNSETAKKVITNIEVYFNDKSSEHEKIMEYFGGKIRAEIIDEFSSQYTNYQKEKDINFDLELKQKAYVYLVSLSSNDSCLLYPNLNDQHEDKHAMGSHSIPSNNSYSIQANTSNVTEKFYLISSVRPIYFDNFKQQGIFKCASRNIGIQKISQHQTNQFSDYRLLKIKIK
jgi:hypothetical protein